MLILNPIPLIISDLPEDYEDIVEVPFKKDLTFGVQSLNISLGPKRENRDLRDFNFLTFFFLTNKMPPQRTLLGFIFGNRMWGEETKLYIRGKIVRIYMTGAKPHVIRKAL